MKHIVIWLCEITISALCVFFCISVIFRSAGEQSIFKMAKEVANSYDSQEINWKNNVWIQQIVDMPPPEVRMENNIYRIGEEIVLPAVLQIRQGEENPWEMVEESEYIKIKLMSIADKNGKILMHDINKIKEWENSENGQWISYVPKQGILSFGKSGSYELKMRVTGDYGRSSIVKVAVLVEA